MRKQDRQAGEKFSLRRYCPKDSAKIFKVTPIQEKRRRGSGRDGRPLPNEPKQHAEIEERYQILDAYLCARQVQTEDKIKAYCPIAKRLVVYIYLENHHRQNERLREFCNRKLGFHVYQEQCLELAEFAS